jgi:hypothetical protein
MLHSTGISRHQLRFSSLEDTISADNPVRFIDAFVGILDLTKLGFISKSLKSEGRSSYHIQLTGLEKVNGEHSLIMLVYNIKRSINILSVLELIAKLKNWKSPYKAKVIFT